MGAITDYDKRVGWMTKECGAMSAGRVSLCQSLLVICLCYNAVSSTVAAAADGFVRSRVLAKAVGRDSIVAAARSQRGAHVDNRGEGSQRVGLINRSPGRRTGEERENREHAELSKGASAHRVD